MLYFSFAKSRLRVLGALFLSIAYLPALAQNPGYHVLNTYHIASTGWWDYINVNHALNRLYVSHGSQVNILNESTGDSVGMIPNTPGVHGIAFATPFGKGFTSDGGANQVTVFDLKSNKVLGTIPTGGGNPDAIIYDPYSRKIITCDGRSNEASVIDPASDKMIKIIPLGGRPETPVADGAGKIFINIESTSEEVEITTSDWTIKHRWPLAPGRSPSGNAMDTRTHRLFIGCDNKMMIVMNAENGQVLASLPTGQGCDGTDFDPGRKFAFSSNGEGTLTIIKEVDPDHFKVVANVPTRKGARTSTVDPVNHRVFLPTAEFKPQPAPTPGQRRRRPDMVAGSFQIVVVGNH